MSIRDRNQGGKEVLLKPNQKGVFDQVSGKITVEDVDVLALSLIHI